MRWPRNLRLCSRRHRWHGHSWFWMRSLRRLRKGPPSWRTGGRRSCRRPCLKSRARHIPVPFDPQCGRTASFGASRTAVRSPDLQRGTPPARVILLSPKAEDPRTTRQMEAPHGSTAPRHDGTTARRHDVGCTTSHLPGSCDRSHDPDDHEGRRTLGLCPKWHMDVPRPFVKTGCRPEGWAIAPGCGGPPRRQRFQTPTIPHSLPTGTTQKKRAARAARLHGGVVR